MANEFIARKGLISLADSQITGSLNLSGDLGVVGSISGTVTGTASTASYVDLANVDGSASLATNIANNSASAASLSAASSSYLLNTTDTLTGDLTVTGEVVAQTLHVQQVTSSIVYSSGSNVFGENVSDTQTFTGSLQVSGSTNYFLGDVGIGTSSPSSKLHVDNPSADAVIRLTKGSSTIGNIDFVNEGNRFSIQDDGAKRLVIDTNGNVGIGTTSPSSILQVESTDPIITLERNNNGNAAGAINFQGNDNVVDWQIGTNHAVGLGFEINQGSDTNNKFYIAPGGNVGIGATSPQGNLHINEDTSNSYAILRLEGANRGGIIDMYNQASYPVSRILTDQSGNIYISTSGAFGSTSLSEKFTILTGGAVGIANTSPDSFTAAVSTSASLVIGSGTTSVSPGITLWQGNSAQASLNFASANTGTGQYEGRIRYVRDTGKMDFRANGNDVMLFDASGRVGIGTDSPAEKLTINGTSSGAYVRISNAASGDISSGFMIYNGSNLDTQIYTNPTFGNTTFLTREALAIRAGGSQRMIIKSDGNVGIGTTNPVAKFEVTDGSSSITLQEYSSGAAIFLDGVNGDFTGGDYFHILADGNTYLGLGGYGGGTTPLNISNAGNVIIGATAINSSFGASNTILSVKGSSSGGEGILQLVGLSNNATDIPARVEFHSQAEADPMCSIRATRGSADDIGDLSFLTNNGSVPQTRMRITSDGNVGINTTSPSVKFEVREGHSLLGGTQNNYGGNVFTTTLGGYGVLSTGTDRYGSYGWLTFNANNNYTGAARKFAFTNGYQTNKFALLIGGSGPTDPTLGSQGDISVGQLIFHVNNSADFMFGKVAGDGNGPHLQVNSYSYTSTFQGTSTSDMITIKTGTELNSNVGAIIFRDNGSDYCGQITVNGSTNTVQYLSASDYRLKEDFKDFNGIDLVDKINVYDFKWKKTDVRSYGVVAHELKEVLPLVVDGNKDEEKYQTVDYGKIVPILIKSIQELKAEIDALKNA